MTTLTKTVRRVTMDTYGYGRKARKLVAMLEKGYLITIREHGRRTKHTLDCGTCTGGCSGVPPIKSAWRNCAKSRPAKPPGLPPAANAKPDGDCSGSVREPAPARGSSHHEPVVHRVRCQRAVGAAP